MKNHKLLLCLALCALPVNQALAQSAGSTQPQSSPATAIPAPPQNQDDEAPAITREELNSGGDSMSTLFNENAARDMEYDGTINPEESKRWFSLPRDFIFPDHTFRDPAHPEKPRTGALFGIDISQTQDPDRLNISALAGQNIKFVYIKATYGARRSNVNFSRYWNSIGALKGEDRPYRGAYHFLSPHISGKDNARIFIDFITKNVDLKDGKFSDTDLPPSIDFEQFYEDKDGHTVYERDKDSNIKYEQDRNKNFILDTYGNKIPKRHDAWEKFLSGNKTQDAVNIVLECAIEIEKQTGKKPLIYTNMSFLRGIGINAVQFNQLSAYKIWLATYSKEQLGTENPKLLNQKSWLIWQFTESATLAQGYDPRKGYEKTIDANKYVGDIDSFRIDFNVKPLH